MKKIIVANWKLNPETLNDAINNFKYLKKHIIGSRSIQTIIAPPTAFLYRLSQETKSQSLIFAVQDVSTDKNGELVGETSAPQAKSIGAKCALLGHSASLKNDPENVRMKLAQSIKSGLVPILFFGESDLDEKGKFLTSLRNDIRSTFKGINPKFLKGIVVVYEPVWAVGKSAKNKIPPKHIHTMTLFIKKILIEIIGSSAKKIPILYGGSVNPDNVEEIFSVPTVDGVVLGRASFNPKIFVRLFEIVKSL